MTHDIAHNASKIPLLGTAPDIVNYLDYRVYLRDSFDYLQSLDRKFSQRWIAKRAGFHSPQLLTMIVKGQRALAKDKIPELAIVLKLDDRATEYFGLLVDLAESTTHDTQVDILKRIQIGFREGLFAPISEDRAIIFKYWYYPAIRELVTLSDAPSSRQEFLAWVVKKLAVTPEEASEALEVLTSTNFLKIEQGTYVRSEPSVRTGRDRIYPMYLAQYYLSFLEKAFSSVLISRDRRYFEGLTFAMPRSAMPVIQEMIQRFFREVDALVENYPQREEIYHMHLALFPLMIDTGVIEPSMAVTK